MPFIGNSINTAGSIYVGGSSYYTTSFSNTWNVPPPPKRARPEYKDDIEGNRTYYNARGEVHRDREPAIIGINGNRWWYQYNEEHREDGPSFEAINGNRHWMQRGKFHRINGPAIEYANHKEWWLNGKRHREDGPAYEVSGMTKEYWYHGRRLLVSSTNEAMRFIHADKYL